MELALERAKAAGLNNIEVVHGGIEDFHTLYKGSFDVAIGFHACGAATDYAQL